MKAILINRQLTDKESDEVLSKVSANKEFKLFSSIELTGKITLPGIERYILPPVEKRKINYQILDQVLEFGELNINGTSISDLLTFEKTSIWHYHKFRTYFYIRNIYYEISLIEKLCRNYDEVIYYAENSFIKHYKFAKSIVKIIPLKDQGNSNNYSVLIKYLIFFKLRVFLGIFYSFQIKKKNHIIVDHSSRQLCINYNSLKEERGNSILSNLFAQLNQDFLILEDVNIPKIQAGSDFKWDSSYFRINRNRIIGENILLRGLFVSNIRTQLKAFSQRLHGIYNTIDKKELQPIHKLILKYFESLHNSSRFYFFKYLAYKRFFSKYPVKSITSIDENSARIKTILDAAKATDIKTIGIQHGAIHDLHPAYIYTSNDKRRKVVPDNTLVWGEYWEKFLYSKGNYPKNSIIKVGQIRTDIINKLLSVQKKKELSLPQTSNLVLFASQLQRDPFLRKQAAKDVFQSIKNVPGAFLIVKLHPGESNDFDYYNNIARETNVTNYQIILQIDLYYLISLCNVIITCFSTVGGETVYFNKPLIILDHLKQDIQNYKKEGIAFQATNEKELTNLIHKILNGKLSINAEKYRNYIRKYAYKIDGDVSKRIINFIKSSTQAPEDNPGLSNP